MEICHFGAAEWEAANLDLITSLAMVFLCEHGQDISALIIWRC